MTFPRRSSVLTLSLLGLAGAALIGATSASAHVSVSSPSAVQGGYATLTFTVPTESATLSTMELKVQLPSDKPLASVSILPKSGWSYLVTKSKLATPIKSDDGDITEAISTIDWKADSAASAIKPGEFDQFVISAGPLPTASSITFKVLQTYSDGSVVSWIEQAAPGSSAEPQHPAPTLTLAPAGTDASASGHSASSSADGDHTEATIATVLGGVGVLLGAAALGVVLIRTRRTS